jgi:glycosyltransferase involved in cell wall biosynthesis
MKVLVTTPDLDEVGGVANFYATLREYFSEDVEYFTACKRNSESKLGSILRLRSDYKKFTRKLLGEKYNIVHLNPSLGFKAIVRDGNFLRIAKKSNKKVIVFIHGWNKNFENKLRDKWLWLFRKYYFQADAFIVLAEQFKKKLQAMGYYGPVFVENTAVDNFVVKYYESHRIKGQRDNHFNMLFLTRIEKAKGIYEAIDAYGLLKQKYDNVRFTIAGDGPELANAKKYVSDKKISDIEFKGFVSGDQKLDTFIKADCYVFPSYTEGMPGSVLEAMTLGLPVITRPVGGLKDFFEEGKMGFVTESLEPSVFAELIEELIENLQLRIQMAEYNHNYAKERFIASKVAKNLTHIYQQVMNSN